MAKKISTQELKHRLSICTTDDVTSTDGTLFITRKDVLTTWMKIEAKAASPFSRAGYNIEENEQKQTHLATMRFRRDFDISTAAWLYEERMQSGGRWFKVLATKEDDGVWLVLALHLVERGDNLVKPVADAATEVPSIKVVNHGVSL